MKRNRWIAALLAMSLAVSASAGSITALGANSAPQGSTVLVNPKVNSRVNPIGIDDTDPVFSWQLDSNIIGQSQASYQIKVYKEAPDGELVWDSGVQTSTASTQIEYGSTGEAQPLEACTRYYWTIDVTHATGETLTYQDASYFETGLMDSTMSAWDGAQWIGANDVLCQRAGTSYLQHRLHPQAGAGEHQGLLPLRSGRPEAARRHQKQLSD